MEEQLPGFRFYPTEEELISFYLQSKLLQKREEINRVIPLVEFYSLEPWHLPSSYLSLLLECFIVSSSLPSSLFFSLMLLEGLVCQRLIL